MGIPFFCLVIPGTIDQSTAELLREAGCLEVEMGVQSLSAPICHDVLNRPFDKKIIARAFSVLRKAGIAVAADHILAIPGDTLKNQEEAVLFYNRQRPKYLNVFFLAFYPDTAIVKSAQEQGLFTNADVENINQGLGLIGGSEKSWGTGGRFANRALYGVSTILNLLPLLPRWLVRIVIYSRLYRLLGFRNHVVPRLIRLYFQEASFRTRLRKMLRFTSNRK